MKRCIMGLVLGISAWLGTSTCHAQESLERGLLRQAPELIKYFKDQGYKNIGVLKFMAMHEGKDKFSDNIGAMNLLTAQRLARAIRTSAFSSLWRCTRGRTNSVTTSAP
jgi:hypothetical protein